MPHVMAWKCRDTGRLFVADERVEAWQCPHTGTLFARKSDYQEHLQALGRKRRRERAYQKRLDAAQERIDELHRCSSIEQIERWLEANAQALADRLFVNSSKKAPEVVFENVRIDVTWNAMCSNSHSAPVGKRTNWGGREENEPRGYPGWHGRITLDYPIYHDRAGFFDLMRVTRLRTGTGSGGSKRASCEVTLWEEDWPNLAVMEKMKASV